MQPPLDRYLIELQAERPCCPDDLHRRHTRCNGNARDWGEVVGEVVDLPGNTVAAVGADTYAGSGPLSKGAPPVTLWSAIKREDTHARVYSPFMAALSRNGQATPRVAAG